MLLFSAKFGGRQQPGGGQGQGRGEDWGHQLHEKNFAATASWRCEEKVKIHFVKYFIKNKSVRNRCRIISITMSLRRIIWVQKLIIKVSSIVKSIYKLLNLSCKPRINKLSCKQNFVQFAKNFEKDLKSHR